MRNISTYSFTLGRIIFSNIISYFTPIETDDNIRIELMAQFLYILKLHITKKFTSDKLQLLYIYFNLYHNHDDACQGYEYSRKYN